MIAVSFLRNYEEALSTIDFTTSRRSWPTSCYRYILDGEQLLFRMTEKNKITESTRRMTDTGVFE
jgi:hypothetical protein